MNIFVLDKDPVIAAQMYCDKHVVKMIVEVAQMLSTAHHMHNSMFDKYVYKKTHVNHPCTVWVRQTSENYDWAYKHLKALLLEYAKRYAKRHATTRLLGYLSLNPCPYGNLTEFPQAMPEQYKNSDPVIAYRAYYIGEKGSFVKWQYNSIPKWFSMKMPYLDVSVDYIDCSDDSMYIITSD